MLKRLVETSNDVTALIARLALGIVIFPHGAQKALGWFGGYGVAGTLDFFTAKMGIPMLFALLVIAAEFLGSLGLIVGFLSRVAAFGIFCVMATATMMVHWQVGFFMNWGGKLPAGHEGFEFHILAMALAIVVMVRGAGALSVDRALTGRR